MSRWLCIVNPVAGLPRLTRALAGHLATQRVMPLDLVETRAPGHAERLAREASAYAGLLVVGGDGTIAEVLNGMDREAQELAVLPAGHGNCLARDLGLGSAGHALAVFADGATRALDLLHATLGMADGTATTRRVGSTLAVGYVADVVACAARRFAWLGQRAYTAAALVTRPAELATELPGGPPRPTCIVVNNTAHLANFRAFPQARLDDGLLDVLASDYAWPRQMLHNAAILAGSRRFGASRQWQAPTLEFSLAAPTRLMIDGEFIDGVIRLGAACERAAVRCRAPRP